MGSLLEKIVFKVIKGCRSSPSSLKTSKEADGYAPTEGASRPEFLFDPALDAISLGLTLRRLTDIGDPYG